MVEFVLEVDDRSVGAFATDHQMNPRLVAVHGVQDELKGKKRCLNGNVVV